MKLQNILILFQNYIKNKLQSIDFFLGVFNFIEYIFPLLVRVWKITEFFEFELKFEFASIVSPKRHLKNVTELNGSPWLMLN